jgi:hypothetical protein
VLGEDGGTIVIGVGYKIGPLPRPLMEETNGLRGCEVAVEGEGELGLTEDKGL